MRNSKCETGNPKCAARDSKSPIRGSGFDSESSGRNPCLFGRQAHSAFRNSKGVALIMVLWVVAILSVVALEFCYGMRTEVFIAQNFKGETQRYAMAEGGIERAIAELTYKADARIQQARKNLKPEEVPPEKREWVTDGRPYVVSFDQGTCEVRITGEAGKVNINTVSEATLRKIIGQTGLEEDQRDIVTDSILDWIDADDFYRANGAENAYYQSLKEPYNCKNGNLDSIEELLLVRGVTRDLLYGKKEAKKGEEGTNAGKVGLRDIFSIYASGEQIDINSATSAAMRTILGIPNEVAEAIVKAREEKGFTNQAELLLRVPALSNFMNDGGRFILFQSLIPYYTIESRAKSKEGRSVRGVKAIVKIDPKEKAGYKIIQWVDAIL